MKSSKMNFKKTPSITKSKAEEDFINKAEQELEQFEIKKNISNFLMRIPDELKKKLKKYAYENDVNMNKVCIKAISEYLNRNNY